MICWRWKPPATTRAPKKMLDELGVIRPAMARALDKLKDLPTDIEPIRPAL